MDDFLQKAFDAGEHQDMKRYLYGPLAAYSKNGGKRHRPLICIIACQAVGGSAEQALYAAAAIEHFHTAALVHDDIADNSTLRRGEPCLHIKEGEALAINAGDLALSLLVGTVLEDSSMEDGVKLRVLREMINMTTRTIEGQALDIGWVRDGRFDISEQDYLAMATHKTAYYSGGTPLAVGAIVGGGSNEQVAALRAYGMSTGLAFQLQDDILNLVGEKEAVKKDFRSDITEGKRTLMVVHALSHTQGAERDELLEIVSTHQTDPERLQRAVDIMVQAGSIDYARNYAMDLAQKDREDVLATLPDTAHRELLVSMGDFFVSRIS